MASSLFVSPPFLSHPVTKCNYVTTSQTQSPQPSNSPPPVAAAKRAEQRLTRTTVDSTCTRRFGIGAGLAFVSFLALSEQIRASLQVSQQEATTRDVGKQEEVVLPNGIRYYELRVDEGSSWMAGDVMVINVKGSVQGSGQVFVDTFVGEKKNRAVGAVMGSRPYSKGICEGVEYVIRTMKEDGKRRVIIPPSLGFGEKGADFGGGLQIPPSATLEYVIEVHNISVAAPSYI